MRADFVYLVAGAALLLAVLLPPLLHRWAVSAPLVLVGVGMVLGLTPLPDGLPLNPIENRVVVEHVTELAVIVALMGVGLALDRPLDLRRRAHWRSWSPTWRLLGVAMPLGILGVALLGWWWGGPRAGHGAAPRLGAGPDRPGARLRRAGRRTRDG